MKTIKRGYVKWEENGVFHKEPLYKHPDLLASASVEDQIAAEEVRRLNEAAEEFLLERELEGQEDAEAVLEALKAAPDDVLTAEQLAVDVAEVEDFEDGKITAAKINANTINADRIGVNYEPASIKSNSILTVDLNDDDSNNDGDSD